MKRIVLAMLVVFSTGLSCRDVSLSSDLTTETLGDAAKAFRYFIMLEPAPDGSPRYLYSDIGRHIHAYVVRSGRSELEWETTLGSAVTSLFVTDVDADGNSDLMVSTARGRIIVYDANTYDKLRENFLEPFESITCMASANIDRDPQEEVIFIAEDHLNIYDGSNVTLEWRSQERFEASELIVANVDDDPQLEIILNTGAVVDSRFYNLESSSLKEGGTFGRRLRLLDMNGDGHPEVIGETPDFALKVYDIYAQRAIW
ncbi:MAG: hypothetical protein JSW58_14435 [Candidatus Latescibacterota bacterium]|nr:MAG: hypothetical protein JSW58_14435 [Candidatus Latescibacterota bacterium]